MTMYANSILFNSTVHTLQTSSDSTSRCGLHRSSRTCGVHLSWGSQRASALPE